MSNELIQQETLSLIDTTKFTPDQNHRVAEIVSSLNIEANQEILQFGMSAQKDISHHADAILKDIRSKDSGEVGETLTNLVLKVKEVGASNLDGSRSGLSKIPLSKIPLIGEFLDKTKKFIVKYEKISTQIDTITNSLDKQRISLLKDIERLNHLFEKNENSILDLNVFIAAGQIKLGELVTGRYEELKAEAASANDPLVSQKLHDLTQLITRFEKRLHDLMLSRTIAVQTAPQIRLIQGNNQTLVEKIQSSILTTIPLWRSQVVIAISLFNQRKGIELQRAVTKTTNDLLMQNSELLKQGSIAVAQENEKGIVEIETLKKVNENLITTIEETLRIQEEGREKRRSVEKELIALEQELKTKLVLLQDSIDG